MSTLVSSRRKKLWVIHPNRTVFSQNNCSLGVTLYVRHVIWWTIFWLDWAYYWSLCTKHALQHIWSILYPEQSILVLYNWYTLINPSLSEVLFADWMQFGVKKDPTLQLTQVFFLLCYSKGVSSDIDTVWLQNGEGSIRDLGSMRQSRRHWNSEIWMVGIRSGTFFERMRFHST